MRAKRRINESGCLFTFFFTAFNLVSKPQTSKLQTKRNKEVEDE